MVKPVLEGSKQVTKEELLIWSEDDEVIRRWRKNPLGYFMQVLATALETESKTAENRRKEKERTRKKPKLSEIHSVQTSYDIPPSPIADIVTLTSTLSSMSATTESVVSEHKRTVSAATTASYGASSTDSPPRIIDKPESDVQTLQNTFVQLVMQAIWGVGVPIPWAQGRKMWLDYAPYFLPQTYPSNSRANPTSFMCLLPDNQTNNTNTVRKDRVIANSDVALIIKTNKKDGGAGRLIWDKQKTAIAFEVTSSLSKNMIDKKAKKISHEFLTAIKSQEQNISKAMANTRAAQMYAEMLGIVCHPEYYQQGEQTVNLFKICEGGLICRLLLSTLLVSKPPFTGPPSHPISSALSIPEESRNCQKQ